MIHSIQSASIIVGQYGLGVVCGQVQIALLPAGSKGNGCTYRQNEQQRYPVHHLFNWFDQGLLSIRDVPFAAHPGNRKSRERSSQGILCQCDNQRE